MARLIERLDAAIAATLDPQAADHLKAERAATLARCGQLAEARAALRSLRAQAQRRRQAPLRAWVSLVDGLLAHFEALSPDALAHFTLARQGAAEAGDARLQALAAAWQGAALFNARRLPEMTEALVAAWTGAPVRDDGGVRARVQLVRADASRLAGLHAAAQRHYLAVRQRAMADGDIATLAAMAHNRMSFQTDRLDLLDAFGEAPRDEARGVLLEAESCLNLGASMGHQALGAVTPLMKARLLGVLERWDEAIALFDACLPQARQEGMGHLAPHLLLDRAWCLWRAGRVCAALTDLAEARPLVDHQPDADDRAASHARLASLLSLHGDRAGAARHAAAAEAARQAFEGFQARLAAELARIDQALGA